ncbi:hypothetical protein Q8W71_31455 [Methylobacterium sp. NEAU 140]|uniref:hypothetical protein n=1 Tax=Methylobacterium sp. NEAU 140 TaxID=3064945 RepID=UPI002735DBA8|nr:hypothetical protein [Methylobacterium sp. NEAU 140]MDP4027103.1 hypothetical protein [Methylobacterium sp. NEAU 140]
MIASLTAPATQVCAFVLGCALIHAARAHAASVTHALSAAALFTLLILLGASLDRAADCPDCDAITVFDAA